MTSVEQGKGQVVAYDTGNNVSSCRIFLLCLKQVRSALYIMDLDLLVVPLPNCFSPQYSMSLRQASFSGFLAILLKNVRRELITRSPSGKGRYNTTIPLKTVDAHFTGTIVDRVRNQVYRERLSFWKWMW